jgi:hypothetical protein
MNWRAIGSAISGGLAWASPDSATHEPNCHAFRPRGLGHFLYNTNRGHNSVTMFEIEPDSGELEVIGWESTCGQAPRDEHRPVGKFSLCRQPEHRILPYSASIR